MNGFHFIGKLNQVGFFPPCLRKHPPNPIVRPNFVEIYNSIDELMNWDRGKIQNRIHGNPDIALLGRELLENYFLDRI
jgi:hypothetical protein